MSILVNTNLIFECTGLLFLTNHIKRIQTLVGTLKSKVNQ